MYVLFMPVMIVAVVVVVVVVVVVIHLFVPLGTSHIYEESPADYVALPISYLVPCFATFSCFFHNGPLPGLLQSSSSSGSLQIPIQ
jgi:hypothetical protein